MNKPNNVWIVDDDRSIRWVLEKALNQAGINTATFESGESAAQRLRTERILDVAVEVLNDTDPYVAGASQQVADASLKRIYDRIRADSTQDPEFQSRILSLLGSIHARRGDNTTGLGMAREALAIATRAGLDDALVAELAAQRELDRLGITAAGWARVFDLALAAPASRSAPVEL